MFFFVRKYEPFGVNKSMRPFWNKYASIYSQTKTAHKISFRNITLSISIKICLHCLGHRIKYGNPKAGNTTQQLLLTTRPYCSFELIESIFFWMIFVKYNIGTHIYIASYTNYFLFTFNSNAFSALHAKHFETWKDFLQNWWIDCFIARSINWCDTSGCL